LSIFVRQDVAADANHSLHVIYHITQHLLWRQSTRAQQLPEERDVVLLKSTHHIVLHRHTRA